MFNVKLGPLSLIHFSKLEEKLNKLNIPFQKIEDLELMKNHLDSARQKEMRDPTRSQHPVYSGISPEYIYLEIDKEAVLLLKQDLDNIGVTWGQHLEPEPIEEYLCTECSYISESQGRCPVHKKLLLNYSDWVEDQKKVRPMGRFWRYLLLSIPLGLLALAISDVIKDQASLRLLK